MFKNWRTRRRGTRRQVGKKFSVKKDSNYESPEMKIVSVQKERRLQELFDKQDALIEHKYPIEGVWALILTHAGDIYRGICSGKQNSAYIMEKLERLKRYIDEPINEADFRYFRYYSDGGYYHEYKHEGGNVEKYKPEVIQRRKREYLENLLRLREETEKTEMDTKRKEAMINSLDMIEKLAKYYETTPKNLPYHQFEKLENSVKTYLDIERLA